MASNPEIQQLKEGILSKQITALAKAISLVESTKPDDKEKAKSLISEILPYTGNSRRIGISGTPGAGKSTFIESYGPSLTDKGISVAVLAVDPSSTITKGSILGDKTRMTRLSKSDLAFIRPSPSRGYYGGVAISTYESILLCEAYGFETILVETVGVGQSETMVKDMVDLFLLVAVSGGGDELQGMKRGIMEIADMVFINKVDDEPSQADINFYSDLKRALPLFPDEMEGWTKPVIMGSSVTNKNIDELGEKISEFFNQYVQQGYREIRRADQNEKRFDQLLQQTILDKFLSNYKNQEYYNDLLEEVRSGKVFSLNAVDKLLQNIG